MSADDFPTVKVRDLLDLYPARPDGLAYVGDVEDFAEPRDSLMSIYHGSDFRHAYADEEGATLVEIPNTSWGDYGGSLYERVNHAALVEDYPTHVVQILGGYGSHSLYLVLDAEIPEVLAEDVERLIEYGHLDESDLYYQIEDQMFADDWAGWMGRDFRGDVIDALTGPDGDERDVEDMVPDVEALLDALTETSAWQNGMTTYQPETATSGYLTNAEAAVEEIAAEIVRGYAERVEIEGQGVLL